MKNITFEQIHAECQQILSVWKNNPDFQLKGASLVELEQEFMALQMEVSEFVAQKQKLLQMRNVRDERHRRLMDLCIRARAGMKGYFGPNSTQYGQAGGTRQVDRRKGGRRTAGAPVSSEG